jgi:hypothetical protein
MTLTNSYAAKASVLEEIIQKFPHISNGIIVKDVCSCIFFPSFFFFQMLFSCFICGLDAMKDVHVLLSHLGGMHSFAPQCPFISMMLMKQIIAVLRNISATASKQYNLGFS